MKTRTQVWLECLALAGILTASAGTSVAATICVNPTGSGGCQNSIQNAVTLALGGDTVKIAPGTYFENVIVPPGKDGLQIIGAGKAATILDAGNYAQLGITTHTTQGILIQSQFVQVKNLMIRNGASVGIEVDTRGAILSGLNITGADGGGIIITDWNGQVLQTEIHDTPFGIQDVGGFGSVLKGVTITNCLSFGALIQSDQAQITGSQFLNDGSFGVLVFGDAAVIKSSSVRHNQSFGVLVSGNFPSVLSNNVLGAPVGIEVTCVPSCFGGFIAGNTVTDTTQFGILAQSDSEGLAVQKNVIVRAGTGISANGLGISLTSNKVTDAGVVKTDDCFQAIGDRQTLTTNVATNCSGAGFFLNGSQQIATGNSATSAFENGFTIDGTGGIAGSALTKNKTAMGGGQGFAVLNGPGATTFTSNTASKNLLDFCDPTFPGDGTVLVGNSFPAPVGAVACPIVH